MHERTLSIVSDLVLGVAMVVAFRDAIIPSPNIGWVIVSSGVGMILLAVAGVAFPDATLLGKELGTTEKPRWLSLTMLALGGIGILFAFVPT